MVWDDTTVCIAFLEPAKSGWPSYIKDMRQKENQVFDDVRIYEQEEEKEGEASGHVYRLF